MPCLKTRHRELGHHSIFTYGSRVKIKLVDGKNRLFALDTNYYCFDEGMKGVAMVSGQHSFTLVFSACRFCTKTSKYFTFNLMNVSAAVEQVQWSENIIRKQEVRFSSFVKNRICPRRFYLILFSSILIRRTQI